jgi:acetyl esterase
MGADLHPEAVAVMPEAVIIAAECDPISPQSRGYAAALTSAGVAVELHTYPGMIHGFAQYPDRFEAARSALTYAGRVLAQALRNSPDRQAADQIPSTPRTTA